MGNVASPLAQSKGEIVFLDAAGNEVQAGGPNVASVRTEGFELLRNGDFRVVATYHPNPPPPEKRRCKTKGGRLPANPRPASSDDDEAVAVRDAERIRPALDPPALAPNETSPVAGGRTGLGNVIRLAADGFLNNPPRNSTQAAVLQARARHRPPLYAVRLSARRGDAPHGQTRPFRLTAHDIQALVAHATRLEAGR